MWIAFSALSTMQRLTNGQRISLSACSAVDGHYSARQGKYIIASRTRFFEDAALHTELSQLAPLLDTLEQGMSDILIVFYQL